MAQIFISYAREDFQQAKALYQQLSDHGFSPWMDKVDLIGGQQWRPAIEQAIRRADFFVLLLSRNSVKKRDFVQREIRAALDLWKDKLADDIYLIPVMLEAMPWDEVPNEISEFQWIEHFEPDGWEQLRRALELGTSQRGILKKSSASNKPLPAPLSASTTVSEPALPKPIPIIPEPVRTSTPAEPVESVTVPVKPKPRPVEPAPQPAPIAKTAGTPKALKAVMSLGLVGALSGAIYLGSQSGKPVTSPTTTEQSAALPSGKEFIETVKGVKLAMVNLPAGSFTMGSPANEADRSSDEGPQHRVNVPAFAIGKTEITQAQWQAVMGNNPSNFKGDNLPVEQVSWEDAKAFCQKLSQLTGKAYRLPTEAEWEYAARAGTTGAYAGNLDAMAWYDKNSGDKTHPVGQKQANAFGLFDMHGNVWEWCEDVSHDNYNKAPSDGAAWLTGGESQYRVVRGGSWRNYGTLVRSALRSRNGPGNRNFYIGFRVVLSARTP